MMKLYLAIHPEWKYLICSSDQGIVQLREKFPAVEVHEIGFANLRVPPGTIATIGDMNPIAEHNLTGIHPNQRVSK